jgi:peptidoglycan/LPS O-acetylase OafA/YrhL
VTSPVRTVSAPPAPPAPDRQPRTARAFRADIQGLRAIAVSLVLLFHLWPNRLGGGFVGVDVFFVISGFLITSHLYSRPPRTGRDLAAFWSRRVRRLLPASLLVLAATAVATRLVAPETQWAATAHEVIAAAMYVENWQLARSSVDYLAAENAASPVQHFWSLSVEEQFYLVWPVLMLLLVALSRRRGWRSGAVVSAGLGVVVAASLAFSVTATVAEPASAYFITPTRIWELGVGALLAIAAAGAGPRLSATPGWLRALLAWAGLGAILVAGLRYTGATPFPGWQAALPVLGAAAVIGARAGETGASPVRLLALRPVQLLGDISYSVYLWHWPMVVLVPYVSGSHLGRLDKAAIILLTAVLAWLSKTYVEDRFRFAVQGVPVRRSFQLAAAGMAVVVALGVAQTVEVGRREDTARATLAKALSSGGPCFGAAALSGGTDCAPSTRGPSVPAPAQAADDKTEAYDRDCFEPAPFTGVRRCVFGDPKGAVSIALVGNSHAGHWLPAVERVARDKGWKVTTFLASECTANRAAVAWDATRKQRGCLGWAGKVLDQTSSGEFDLVVTSERNGRAAAGRTYDDSYPAWLSGYRKVVAGWVRARTNVLVIHDTATPGATLKSVPDCLAQHEDRLLACAGPRRRWVPRDPLVQAAREAGVASVSTVDLNDHLCDGDTCPAVIGGVTVYSDASHMTKTFATTLAPYLEPSLTRAVARASAG